MDHSIRAFPNEIVYNDDIIDENFLELARDLAQWGMDRGITRANGATIRAQVEKLKEELDELVDAWETGKWGEVIDGLGDSQVVLIQLARLTGCDLTSALEAAWNEIESRKGQMCHGFFVKEESIYKLQSIGVDLKDIQSLDDLKKLLAEIKEK